MRVAYGLEALVVPWVLQRLPQMDAFGPCTALAVLDSRGAPFAGLVFHDYQPQWSTIQISMAADSARWATRNVVRELLAYPFRQLGVHKCWTSTAHTNERALRFNSGIGFMPEAVLERQFGEANAVICRMFNNEYEERYGRKKLPEATGST